MTRSARLVRLTPAGDPITLHGLQRGANMRAGAYARANPGKINYGSAGHGTPQNICCELFKMMTGVDLVHVPYRGGAPATTDLVGGQIQVIFSPVSESIEHIKAGKLRALAVTTAT